VPSASWHTRRADGWEAFLATTDVATGSDALPGRAAVERGHRDTWDVALTAGPEADWRRRIGPVARLYSDCADKPAGSTDRDSRVSQRTTTKDVGQEGSDIRMATVDTPTARPTCTAEDSAACRQRRPRFTGTAPAVSNRCGSRRGTCECPARAARASRRVA
jgi:hypothetical protein